MTELSRGVCASDAIAVSHACVSQDPTAPCKCSDYQAASHARRATMRRLAADVAWSVVVCVFVCCTRPRNLQKRLNRSTSCRSGRGLGWDHVLGGGPDTPGKGQFRELFPPLKCRNEISHGLHKQQTPQQSLVRRKQLSAANERLPVASELWGQGTGGVHCTPPKFRTCTPCTPQVKDAAYVKILSKQF